MVKSVQKVAVLGAGVMGSTIAGLIAGSGAKVLLLDIVPRELDDADKAKGLTKDSPEFRNKLALAGIARLQDKKMGMLYSKTHLPLIETGNFDDDMEKIADCDWIVEVVMEKVEIKQSVMKTVAKYRKPGTIVSTNTSGISIAAIGEGQDDEFMQHFLGTHFFNPPRFMHLFELIPNAKTLPEVLDVMRDFGENGLGKGVVIAKDTPNFIGNRIGTYASIIAMRYMQKYGFDIPTLDALTGPVMGHPKSATMRTNDMVGLDVFCHVADNVVNADVPEDEKKRFEVPEFMKDLVERGALGDKTRHGFYEKKRVDGKRVVKVWDIDKKEYVDFDVPRYDTVKKALKSDNKYATFVYGDDDYSKFAWEFTRDLLIYAAEKVPEIADDYKEIDKAIHWGFNWETGPFQTWDAIGVEKSIEKMKAEGCTIPAWVEKRVAEGKTSFYEKDEQFTSFIKLRADAPKILEGNEEANLRDLGDGVLLVEFHGPGNSIGQEAMAIFNKALDEYLDKDEWRGLVVGNQGAMFSAGANIATIAFGISDKEWGQIEEGVNTYQQTNMRLKYSRKPVVAAPFNRVLGGGLECVMHATFVTPDVESYMGLVEPGVGLLPGAGGNKEYLIRHYEAAGSDKPSDLLPAFVNAFQAVAMASVSTNAFDAIDKHQLRACQTKVIMNRDAVIDEAKKKVIELFEAGYMPPKPAKIKVLGDYARGVANIGLDGMVQGGFVSEYDAHIAKKVAWVMSGGNAMKGTIVDEQYLLDLEREAFLSLCGEQKTYDRIEHMMTEGKPLRN